MLEKTDLDAIQTMIDHSIDRAILASEARMTQEFDQKLDQRFQESEARITQEFNQKLDQRFQESEARMTQKFDDKIQESEARMTRKIEEASEDAYQRSIAAMNLMFENRFMPQFQLLLEGQQMLLETLAPISRVEALEDDVALLKQVVRDISEDVEALKKAQ